MQDTVKYRLPFGALGSLAHRLMVKKRVDDIFTYRRKVLEDLFN
jgi:ligand-binding SRPBCC domain-containing protein